jgi:uncharacterized protein (TIGR03435 family)
MRRAIFGLGLLAAAMAVPAQTAVKAKLPQFAVVSIKQDLSGEERGLMQIVPGGDRILVTNAPMYRILQFAFDFQKNDPMLGAPEWLRTERWDIDAQVDPADLAAFHALDFKHQKAMLQAVLIDRCRMQASSQKRVLPVYALELAKGGLKMHEVRASEEPPAVRNASGAVVQEWDITVKPGNIRGRDVPMQALLYGLVSASLDRPVIDRTALTGKYDFDLVWSPDADLDPHTSAADAGLPEGSRMSIFTAMQEQLGLRFEATKAAIDALVIDHIERPTAN